jgi:hypothetical protein
MAWRVGWATLYEDCQALDSTRRALLHAEGREVLSDNGNKCQCHLINLGCRAASSTKFMQISSQLDGVHPFSELKVALSKTVPFLSSLLVKTQADSQLQCSR